MPAWGYLDIQGNLPTQRAVSQKKASISQARMCCISYLTKHRLAADDAEMWSKADVKASIIALILYLFKYMMQCLYFGIWGHNLGPWGEGSGLRLEGREQNLDT